MFINNEVTQFIKKEQFSQIVVIVDEKVLQLYSYLFDTEEVSRRLVIPIVATEQQKSLRTCEAIFAQLLQERVDKAALIVNVGGGITTDIGGFVAATYKRGVRFVNVPTTLLGMVDAAIGGKCGVNFGAVKNAIGIIRLPEQVFVDPAWLGTLPYTELLNGFGEMVKYALIGVPNLWDNILKINKLDADSIKTEWIDSAAQFKTKIVEKDLHDCGERRILNFGHTIAHALESYFLTQNDIFPHGQAVAVGICCANAIAYQRNLIEKCTFQTISDQIQRFFTIPKIPESDFHTLLQFCKNDKKNSHNAILMTLIKGIGAPITNVQVTDNELITSFNEIFKR